MSAIPPDIRSSCVAAGGGRAVPPPGSAPGGPAPYPQSAAGASGRHTRGSRCTCRAGGGGEGQGRVHRQVGTGRSVHTDEDLLIHHAQTRQKSGTNGINASGTVGRAVTEA